MTSFVKLPITSARGLLRSTSSCPENRLHHFTRTAKFIAGQTYGISKDSANSYPEGKLDQSLSKKARKGQSLGLLLVLPPNKFLQLESMVLHSGYLQRTNSIEMGWIPDDEPLTIFENTLQLPTVRKVS